MGSEMANTFYDVLCANFSGTLDFEGHGIATGYTSAILDSYDPQTLASYNRIRYDHPLS